MSFKNILLLGAWGLVMTGCANSSEEKQSGKQTDSSEENAVNKSKTIIDPAERKASFSKLAQLIHKNPADKLPDSVSFLLIPIDAACNACRDKAVAATFRHKDFLRANQFIIISANGLKPIQAYFKEQNKIMPDSSNHIFYDSDNLAFMNDLIFTHPTMFYCYKGESYEKIVSFPLNIKENLEHFFGEK